MPTENRSSNEQKMVSVPQFIGKTPLCGRYYPAICRSCGWVGSSEELTEDDAQCTRDVGDRLCLGDCDELDREDLLGIIQAMAQHQGEPVAWVYLRNGEVNYDVDVVISNVEGDTLGNGDRWAPVFMRPDSGEVERLRKENELLRHDIASFLETMSKTCDLLGVDTQSAQNAEGKPSDVLFRHAQVLRAQLADREALLAEGRLLLREIRHDCIPPHLRDGQIDNFLYKSLSASAESSAPKCKDGGMCEGSTHKCDLCAPVERDERSSFELAIRQKWPGIRMLRINRPGAPADGEYELPGLESAWQGWQARAALERKP